MISIKKILFALISLAWIVVGCTSQESEVQLPKDVPEFVEKSHLEEIDWENAAVRFQGNIIGNENKSGVIGADMPSVNQGQKWMWHLWGVEEPLAVDLTVVGMHKATREVQQILINGWTIGLGGENNEADAHAPSSVNLPEAGEWAILLYTNGELFDTLIYEIEE